MCLEQIKTWTEIVANITTVIGIFFAVYGGGLALRQWQLQRYDKFYAIYRHNIDLINAALGMRLSNQVLKEYAFNVLDQGFLFKPKARSFFQELDSQANDLLTRESLLKGQLSDADRKNQQQKQAEILQWFVLQPAETRKIFHAYLKVEN